MTSSFDKVLGHDNAKAFLRGIQGTGRIASGFLFHGAAGRGKRLLALAFIQRLFCDSKEGCGVCPPCRRLIAGNHGDLEVVVREDGKSRIAIEQLRQLREWFHRAPFEAERRCAVIDDAHLMSEEAQNSLLKLLEEPPAGGILILVSDNPQGLLETIHSRLQTVYCGPLATDVIEGLLLELAEVEPGDARRAAVLGRGSPGQALEILFDEHHAVSLEAAHRLFDLKTRPFSYAEMVTAGREKGAELRDKVVRILDMAMELTSQQMAVSSAGHQESDPLPSLAPWPLDVLVEMQGMLVDAVQAVRGNAASRLVLESLKIRLHRTLAQARRQMSVPGSE